MREFLLKNWVIEAGKERTIPDNFLEAKLYPVENIRFENGNLVLARGNMRKEFLLRGERTKINFPVNFVYEFERTYLIKFYEGK